MIRSSFYRVCGDVDWDRSDRYTWWESFWCPLPVRPRNVGHFAGMYIFFPLAEHLAKTHILWSYIYRPVQTGRAQDLIHPFDIADTSPPLKSVRQMCSPLFLLAYPTPLHSRVKLLFPSVIHHGRSKPREACSTVYEPGSHIIFRTL